MPGPKFWTPERDETLRQLHQKKTSNREAAKILGVTIGALAMRKGSLGLHVNFKWTPVAMEQLRQLAPTANAAVIAKQLGCTVSAVTSKRYELGIRVPRKKSRWNDASRAQLRALYASGKTFDEIARVMGVSVISARSQRDYMHISRPRRHKTVDAKLEREQKALARALKARERVRRMVELTERIEYLKRWKQVLEAA